MAAWICTMNNGNDVHFLKLGNFVTQSHLFYFYLFARSIYMNYEFSFQLNVSRLCLTMNFRRYQQAGSRPMFASPLFALCLCNVTYCIISVILKHIGAWVSGMLEICISFHAYILFFKTQPRWTLNMCAYFWLTGSEICRRQ